MKTYTSIQTEAMSAITCDRCQATFSDGDDGWTETLLIEYTAGYGSIFGDGNTVAIDLCQDCLKQTLGKWLRVGDHRSREKAAKDELIANTHDRLPRVRDWDEVIPVDREYGADSVRFTRVLKRVISAFGDPLEAVQWLTAGNAILGGQPMQYVVASEEGFQRVSELLSVMENQP